MQTQLILPDHGFPPDYGRTALLPNSPTLMNAAHPKALSAVLYYRWKFLREFFHACYMALITGGGVRVFFQPYPPRRRSRALTSCVASGPLPFIRALTRQPNAVNRGEKKRANMACSTFPPIISWHLANAKNQGGLSNFNISVYSMHIFLRP